MQARLAKARMLASLQITNPNATMDDLDMPEYEEQKASPTSPVQENQTATEV
jgi:hypothetical protein